MANKLQRPADDKESQGPTPIEKEERQRQHNHWHANGVRKPVQGMPMLGFVSFEEIRGHGHPLFSVFGLWSLALVYWKTKRKDQKPKTKDQNSIDNINKY